MATYTLDEHGIEDLGRRLLARRGRPGITAADLGVAGSASSGSRGVPAGAVLVRLCWPGPPESPHVHGHFRIIGHPWATLRVELPPPALHELDRRL